jgi:hypothetical protein
MTITTGYTKDLTVPWVLVGGSTIVLVVTVTFGVAGVLLRRWNWARPVPEGDRARC